MIKPRPSKIPINKKYITGLSASICKTNYSLNNPGTGLTLRLPLANPIFVFTIAAFLVSGFTKINGASQRAGFSFPFDFKNGFTDRVKFNWKIGSMWINAFLNGECTIVAVADKRVIEVQK